MPSSWKTFLFVQAPAAALALALAAQALAISLSRVTMWRDRADELALAVLSDPTNYNILLFGDSITRDATVRFALGAPGYVANLSTNGYVGLVGSLFLLQRYLSVHPPPQHVVIALAPGVYPYENDPNLARYHLWHTFTRPDERKLLKTYFPGIDQRDWIPAIVDLQERIVEPLFSVLKQRYLAFRGKVVVWIAAGSLEPTADAPVELAQHTGTGAGNEVSTDPSDLGLSPSNADALKRLCDASATYGFSVSIIWPPIRDDLEEALVSSGALPDLQQKIRSVMGDQCRFVGFFDFNGKRTYPIASFHHDMTHLFGDGWEQRYTSDLRDYLAGLSR